MHYSARPVSVCIISCVISPLPGLESRGENELVAIVVFVVVIIIIIIIINHLGYSSHY
jgi:hypothetical protein